jgi:hypothetical protein
MKKILIISTADDMSTTQVMRWIRYLNADVEMIRLHAESLINGSLFMDFSTQKRVF